jgi:hypothetical protein
MRRTILLGGVLPFVSAFLGGALALSLVAPSSATAQSSQLQEVRASAFILEGPDGTVLARLAPAAFGGTGILTLYDAHGTRRLAVVGDGVVSVFAEDGTTHLFRAGRTFGLGPAGQAPVNGVLLGPGGSIGMIPPLP